MQNHVTLSSCLEDFHAVRLYDAVLLSWAVGEMICRKGGSAGLWHWVVQLWLNFPARPCSVLEDSFYIKTWCGHALDWFLSNNCSRLIWTLHKYSNKWEDFYCRFNSTQSTIHITIENRTTTWQAQIWLFPNSVGSVWNSNGKIPRKGIGGAEITLSAALWRCCCLWGRPKMGRIPSQKLVPEPL